MTMGVELASETRALCSVFRGVVVDVALSVASGTAVTSFIHTSISVLGGDRSSSDQFLVIDRSNLHNRYAYPRWLAQYRNLPGAIATHKRMTLLMKVRCVDSRCTARVDLGRALREPMVRKKLIGRRSSFPHPLRLP